MIARAVESFTSNRCNSSVAFSARRYRILSTDDNNDDAGMLKLLFEVAAPQGDVVEFKQVKKIAEAQQELHKQPFDLAVLDGSTEKKHDGFGLLNWINQTDFGYPKPHVVMHTGDKELETIALKAGAKRFFVKGQDNAEGLVQAMFASPCNSESLEGIEV